MNYEQHRDDFEGHYSDPDYMKSERRGNEYANLFDTRRWESYQWALADMAKQALSHPKSPEADSDVMKAQAAPVAQLSEPPKLAFDKTHIDYIHRYGGFCRDCADENGVCPSSGLPCGGSKKAITHVLEALAYGVNHGYIPVVLAAAPTTPKD